MKGLGLAWRTNRSPNVEQEAVIAIFHLYTPLMSSKRKGRSSAASQSSNQSPEEKRSKNSDTDEVFEALEMAEDVGLKLQRVLNKLEKLDKIEAHLSEVSASLASIEEKVSRLNEDVQDLKQKTNRVEKKASELEASIQFNKRRHFRPKERVKDTRDLVFKFLENNLRIENPRGRIEFQRVHRLGKPNNSSDKPRPIIARFLPYSDKEMVMDEARKELKSQEDKQFSVGKGCTVYFSKA
ncbi:unnamed protein product, partial [Porites evermanni]